MAKKSKKGIGVTRPQTNQLSVLARTPLDSLKDFSSLSLEKQQQIVMKLNDTFPGFLDEVDKIQDIDTEVVSGAPAGGNGGLVDRVVGDRGGNNHREGSNMQKRKVSASGNPSGGLLPNPSLAGKRPAAANSGGGDGRRGGGVITGDGPAASGGGSGRVQGQQSYHSQNGNLPNRATTSFGNLPNRAASSSLGNFPFQAVTNSGNLLYRENFPQLERRVAPRIQPAVGGYSMAAGGGGPTGGGGGPAVGGGDAAAVGGDAPAVGSGGPVWFRGGQAAAQGGQGRVNGEVQQLAHSLIQTLVAALSASQDASQTQPDRVLNASSDASQHPDSVQILDQGVLEASEGSRGRATHQIAQNPVKFSEMQQPCG